MLKNIFYVVKILFSFIIMLHLYSFGEPCFACELLYYVPAAVLWYTKTTEHIPTSMFMII